MDKTMLRLYLIIVVSLMLAVVCLPMIVGRTSAWAQEKATEVRLLISGTGTDGNPRRLNKNKGNVVIVMDDAWETQYTKGYPTLEKYNMKASIAVPPAFIGAPGYMDYAQLAELYLKGWDLLNHTFDHEILENLPRDKQEEQVLKAREWLASHLLDRGKDILVFPDGMFTIETLDILKEQGFVAARSLKSLWYASEDSTFEDVDICNLISDIPLGTAKAAVNKAINNHSTVIFVLHKIEPVTDNSQMQLEYGKFLALVEYVDSKKKQLNILTMTELIELESKAGERIPSAGG